MDHHRISTAPTPAKRRPGRPRKSEHIKSENGDSHDESVLSAPTPRRRGRPRKVHDNGDSAYQPSEPVMEVGDEDEDEDWEVGALAWGLVAVTGLGSASSGVFGAETTAKKAME